ncbi:uncharacterized protein TRAVEDRAFT_53554 [Trametes versicolor FP-101664 SS1]|uniref:uncharacterized protein n=1 Tax=Trametes versicolor (strain FP-101664) TaxID=717944 RepID=UPI0004621867|nr:uncharacterized protein TRAVEDRAFT_53554 [Trametes versicolor FP-101664 SS1]EIW53144.1 hypothetical protein TRAVEDRAFT_53554 [Trametes versicolor FP-101664 SS1]
MSSTYDAEIIKYRTYLMAGNYFEMATTTLLIWHYLLTVDKEFGYFWRKRFSGVCALYLANRYLILVVIVYQTPWWNLRLTRQLSLATNPLLLYFVAYSPLLIEPTIGILVNHFLIELQEAASSPVYLSTSSPGSSNMKDTLPSADGSIGLLQFARADIDGWIRSESAPPSASTYARVKALYEQLGIRPRFAAYEEATYQRIVSLIETISEKPQAKAGEVMLRCEVFKVFLDKIYKRQK